MSEPTEREKAQAAALGKTAVHHASAAEAIAAIQSQLREEDKTEHPLFDALPAVNITDGMDSAEHIRRLREPGIVDLEAQLADKDVEIQAVRQSADEAIERVSKAAMDANDTLVKAIREKVAEIEQLRADCAALREAVIDVDTYHDLYADKACYEGSSADWDKLAPFKAKAETAYKLAIGNNSGQPLIDERDRLRKSNERLVTACERALRYEVDCVASNGADYDEKAAREDFAFIRDARDAAKEAANG